MGIIIGLAAWTALVVGLVLLIMGKSVLFVVAAFCIIVVAGSVVMYFVTAALVIGFFYTIFQRW